MIFSISCAQKPARVLNRGGIVYNKSNSQNNEKYRNVKVAPERKLSSREIQVVQGDTLYSITKKYQVTLHDLIKQNNLAPPYTLHNGMRLKIPSSDYHEVKSGETLYAISRIYGMKVDQLIEMNDLKEPYSVMVGQKVRISKVNNNAIAPVPENRVSRQVVKSESNEGFIEKTLDRLNHFSWPLKGEVVSKFGPKTGGLYNDGINIKAKEGEAVKASEDGVVAYVGNELKGYGNLIIIKHSGGWITAYAHLKDAQVVRGKKVGKGDKIGTVGSTGNVTTPQLYFGLRKGRDAVNPENYLRS